jgi:hypothetical protein
LQQLYPACAEVWMAFIKYRSHDTPSSSSGYGVFEHLSRASARLREWKPATSAPNAAKAAKSSKAIAPKRTGKVTASSAPARKGRGAAKGLPSVRETASKESHPEIKNILLKERENAFNLLGKIFLSWNYRS